MEKEENVYEMKEGAEAATAVSRQGEDRNAAPEQTSAILGKFKDVDALAQAYGSLQAEFTRRSQRLKELEKLTENFGKDGHLGVEKLRKNAEARRVEAKRFEEFLSSNKNDEDTGAETILSETKPDEAIESSVDPVTPKEDLSENGDTVYEMNAETEGAVTKDNGTPNPLEGIARGEANEDGRGDSDELYAKVSRDEKVRLRIIGEYLSSIGKPNAPLMTGGVGTLTTPPAKAHSISAAGDMALLYFKAPRCDS